MDQLIPGLDALVAPFRDCFRAEVFQTFQVLIAGWVVCVGRQEPRSETTSGSPPRCGR